MVSAQSVALLSTPDAGDIAGVHFKGFIQGVITVKPFGSSHGDGLKNPFVIAGHDLDEPGQPAFPLIENPGGFPAPGQLRVLPDEVPEFDGILLGGFFESHHLLVASGGKVAGLVVHMCLGMYVMYSQP